MPPPGQIFQVSPDVSSFAMSPGRGVEHIARLHRRPQITFAWVKLWVGPAGGRVDFH